MTSGAPDDLPHINDQGELRFATREALRIFVQRMEAGVVPVRGTPPGTGFVKFRLVVEGDPREAEVQGKVLSVSGGVAVLLISNTSREFTQRVDQIASGPPPLAAPPTSFLAGVFPLPQEAPAPQAPSTALIPEPPSPAPVPAAAPPVVPPPAARTATSEIAAIAADWHGATLRLRVADPAGVIRFLEEHRVGGALQLADARVPPSGDVTLEALARSTGERFCSATLTVTARGTADPPVATLQVVRIDVGCDEEIRRALQQCAAPAAPVAGPAPDDVVIGIDLGTTNSCVAVVDDNGPRVLPSKLGYNTVPSVVAFDERGLVVVGQPAERRMLTDPERGVAGTKRYIGRPFSDGLCDQLAKHTDRKVTADSEGMAAQQVAGRTLSAIEVGACILKEMRDVAEAQLKRKVVHAVVTVPAYFNENQRAAVRVAGQRAGLNVVRIVNEPTAAAVAFGFKRSEEKTVLVYDLGGGTFDVSVLEISGSLYEVKATAGDTFLGGLDFDRLLADHVRAEIQKQFGMGVADRVGQERIAAAVREAKHELSSTPRSNISLPRLRLGSGSQIVDFTMSLTRESLDALVSPLIDRTITICNEALAAAKLTAQQVGEVLLVGGQTRMPLVRERLAAHFGRPPSKRVNPDEIVALGAALVGGTRDHGAAPTLIDVLPVPIGIATANGVMKRLLVRNQALPASANFTLDVVADRPVILAVFQGDSPRVADNELLGSCRLVEAGDAARAGKVSCTFDLSSECLLTCRCQVEGLGVEKEVKLTTLQTSQAVLAEMGRERVVATARVPTGTATPVAAGAPTGTHKPPPRPAGLWERIKARLGWGGSGGS